MSQDRIRVLVDRSRDSGWSGALVDMEPDTIYQTTDNRDYLTWSVLKNYDVVAICGYSLLEYKDEELRFIRKFVEAGGGLLLASSTSRFERDTGKPISEMRISKIARLFGAEFLPLDRCKAKTKSDDDLLRGYPRENLRLIYHAALAELELDDIPISNCGIVAIPEDAQVFLEHSETKEPIGACVKFGKGRVLVINDLRFSQDSQLTCRAFIDWLAYNRVSKAEGSESIPDEIPVDEHSKEDGKIKIYYTDFVKDRVDICLEFAKKIAEDLIGKLPKNSEESWEIKLNPSCTWGQRWWDPVLGIGAFISDPGLAYALGVQMTSRLDMGEGLGDLIWDAFEDGSPKCLGMMAMKLLGFESEAERMYAEIVRQFREKDPTGKELDMARAYEYHPKLVWILNSLMEKHGLDLFLRFIKAVPEQKDPWKNIPGHVFTAMDVFVYYLSLGLETDLYPWFWEMGATMHPLPLHPRDSDEFKEGMRQYLKDVIRDRNASASDRIDAVWCLIDVCEKEKEASRESEAPAEPLVASATDVRAGSEPAPTDDRYERLGAAMRLSRLSDSRAVTVLKELASDEDDRAIAAIASLALVRKGIASAADRLIETAEGQDYRFQLDAGYALHKIGHEKAEQLSFKGLRDENGNPVVAMKVEYDGYLKLFPTVAGHKVANVFSEFSVGPSISHFPENTHVTGMYVDWVHTAALYRRKGLSRWTMQETFSHKAARRCSCAVLGTGTRNTAHAMYRGFGFVDLFLSESFTKELREEKAKLVDGLMIRSYSPGDEVKMAALANECYSDMLAVGRVRARRPQSSNTYIKIAEKAGEMSGYVQVFGGRSSKEARFGEICVKKTDNRDDIGAALLCALHNDLLSHGFKKIIMDRELLVCQSFLRKLLRSFGYSSRRTGGVDMFKIINLPMLLEELSPLLCKRLKDSDYKDWHGKIGIAGQQHKASVIVGDSEISVSEEVIEDADILLSGDDDTITRIIVGRITPFEAYLQVDLTIQPMVNDRVKGLLETLFPRIPKGS
jgi:ribosomal protein S18 acetylase RimI-like enzyme/putative sterol carrier protein